MTAYLDQYLSPSTTVQCLKDSLSLTRRADSVQWGASKCYIQSDLIDHNNVGVGQRRLALVGDRRLGDTAVRSLLLPRRRNCRWDRNRLEVCCQLLQPRKRCQGELGLAH